MSIVKAQYNTYNDFTGENGTIKIVQRHSSVSRAEVSEIHKRAEIAIAARKNELAQANALPSSTLVHPLTNSTYNLANIKTIAQFVRLADWSPVESYLQTVENVRYVYTIVSKIFDDAKAKTGKRKWFGLAFFSEKREFNLIGKDGGMTLAEIKTRLLTLNAVKINDSDSTAVTSFETARKAKPVITFAQVDGENLEKPITLKPFVIVATYIDENGKTGYEFWDGKRAWVKWADLDLAKRYTKPAAYNTAGALSEVLKIKVQHMLYEYAERIATPVKPVVIADGLQVGEVITAKVNALPEVPADQPDASEQILIDEYGTIVYSAQFCPKCGLPLEIDGDGDAVCADCQYVSRKEIASLAV